MTGMRGPDLPSAAGIDSFFVNHDPGTGADVFKATPALVAAKLAPLVNGGFVLVDHYGAAGDGVTDDASAFVAAFAALPASGGVVILSPGKVYRVSSINVPAYKGIRGDRYLPTRFVGNASDNFVGLGGIALESTGTIKLNAGSFIEHLFVKRYGMTFPAANPVSTFAGTAVTLAGDDARITGATIVGFHTIVKTDAALTYINRYIIDGLYGDGLNGIIINKRSYASPLIRDVHLWPFASQPYVTAAALQKPGDGIALLDGQDDLWGDNILIYGFARGLVFAACGQFNFGKVWIDYPPDFAAGSGSIGLYAGANVTGIRFACYIGYGSEYGIVQQSNATEYLSFGHAHLAILAGSAVTSTGGDLSFDDLRVDNIKGYAINLTSAATKIRARGKVATTGWVAGYNALGVVAAPAGAIAANLDLDLETDQPIGATIHFVNVVGDASIAAASTIYLPVNGSVFSLTGSTTINSMFSGWGGREVTLVGTSGQTIDPRFGNITLIADAITTLAAGDCLRLKWDTVASKWREVSRSRPAHSYRKNDAGASGVGTFAGFFEADTPVNFYPGASSWQHLIECRNGNLALNYSLQIAGSFFDQALYFRKTNNSATTAWTRIVGLDSGGKIPVGFIPNLAVYTVATLPSASVAGAGAQALVTNANATTFGSIVAGGGANVVTVYSDGTNWRIG